MAPAPTVFVVVPTFNEVNNIRRLVGALDALALDNLHVLIVDDNSPDGTGDVADELAACHAGRVHVLHRNAKDGLGRAYVDGMTHALAAGADFVIQMDADLSHPPSAIPRMVAALADPAVDLVIGSRYVRGGSTASDWPTSRRLLSRGANLYVNSILRTGVRDATAGFKAWRASAIKSVDLDRVRANGYAFQIETNHLARRAGLRVVEIPIHFSERVDGASKMSLRVQTEALAAPWRMLATTPRSGAATRSYVILPPRSLSFVVFVVAAATRLAVIFRGAGPRGNFGYDAAVYFAAGDALTHGRLPYRDFVFLHPPGLMIVLAPFSWLAHVTSDDTGFAAACIAFALLGGVNAVLVARLCARLGLGSRPAIAGGLFYAVWFGSVGSEFLTKLEPLGNTALLCALLAALHARRTGSGRWTVLAGAALGLLISVKIWWIVPVLAIAAWHVRRVGTRRSALQLSAGLAAALAVVDLPFFLAAPRAMVTSVVQDQLGRPRSATVFRRFADLTTVSRLTSRSSHVMLGVAVVIAGVLLAGVLQRALRVRACRPAVVLFGLQLVVVLAAPSWFPYYTDYLAVPGAVIVAAAATPDLLPKRRSRIGVGWVTVVATTVLTCLILGNAKNAVGPFRGAPTLARAAAPIQCVMSDAPMGLIEVNSLSRGLAHGCRNWIDVSGRTYGVDAPPGNSVPRRSNKRWQRDLTSYLRSGQAVIIVRRVGSGITQRTRRAVTRDGAIARSGGHTLYRVNR